MANASNSTWVEVGEVDEIEECDVKRCPVGSLYLAVFNVRGTFYATSDICTHAHAHLSEGYIDGDIVECPLHQGRFHIPTGKAVSAPVTEDVRTYPVRIEGRKIFVQIDPTEQSA
ncbi:MAG: non-heme iron oxygenase ferredoxin subunit [Burkholderiaceae bacterium]|nr:non-heme iron oxygenase ferredoxin subunit [Burkholderiaceae bacterium]